MISQADQLAAQAKEMEMEKVFQLTERNISRAIETAKPSVIVAGPSAPAVNGVARKRAPEDEDLMKKVRPFLRKGEVLMQFIARTGISVHQLSTYTHRDLKHLVAVVEGNVAEDTGAIEPKRVPIPSKFYVTIGSTANIDGHLAKNKMPPNVVEVGWD